MCERLGQKDKALSAYRNCYDLDQGMKEVIWKVCDIMASSDEIIQKEKGKARLVSLFFLSQVKNLNASSVVFPMLRDQSKKTSLD